MHRQSCLTSEAARTTSHPRLRKEACSRSEITPLSLMVRRKDDENSKGRKLPDKHTGPQLHSANGRPRCQNTGHRLVPGIPTIKYLAAFPGRQILMVHQGRRGRGQHGTYYFSLNTLSGRRQRLDITKSHGKSGRFFLDLTRVFVAAVHVSGLAASLRSAGEPAASFFLSHRLYLPFLLGMQSFPVGPFMSSPRAYRA